MNKSISRNLKISAVTGRSGLFKALCRDARRVPGRSTAATQVQALATSAVGMRQFASPAVSDATTSVEQWQRGDRSEGLRRAMLSVLIRDLRLSQNMNRAELAEITEIPRERIFALEHGTLPLNQLSIGDIGALAGALGPDSRKLLLWVSGRALAPGPCGPQPRHLRASRKPLPNLFGRICD